MLRLILFVTKWDSQGSGDGQFSGPYDVAIDSLGNVYVQMGCAQSYPRYI